MSRIKFANVPKKSKVHKVLIGKRFNTKSNYLDISTANSKVKEAAKQLTPNSTVELDIIVDPEDGSNATYTAKSVYVAPEDEYSGLQGIADRLVSADDSGEAEKKVANIIEDELRDTVDETMATGLDYLQEEPEREFKEERKDFSNEEQINEERTIGGVPQEQENEYQDTEPKPMELDDTGNDTFPDFGIESPENDETKNESDNEHENLISRASYTERQQSFFVSSADNVVFNVEKLKQGLGYVDNPKNEHERSINAVIDRNIEKCHVSVTKSKYDKDVSRLNDETIDKLDQAYSRINEYLLEDTVEGKAGKETLENAAKAANEKKANEKESVDKKEAHAADVDNQAEKDIADYTKRIMAEAADRKQSYNAEQDRILEKRNRQIDDDLELQNQKTKDKFRKIEIRERNDKLREDQQEIKNKYISTHEALLETAKEEYAENVLHVEQNVFAAIKEMEKKKLKKQKAKNLEKQQKAKYKKLSELASLQKESNELKRKELELEEQKLQKQAAKEAEPVSALPLPEPVQLKQRPKRYFLDLDEEIIEESADSEKNSSKAKHRKRKAVTVVGIAVVLLGVGGYYGISNHPAYFQGRTNTDVNRSKTHHKNSDNQKHTAKPKEKIVEQKDKVEAQKAKSLEAPNPKPRANDSNVIRYYSTKNWAEKVDVLDGALGQGDVRALKQINDYHSTWISSLYYAIAIDDQVAMRNIYLQLNYAQKQKLSSGARHALALAFYDIKDWENGWKSLNGY